VRLLSDENFHEPILKALANRMVGIDLLRAREVGLLATPDPDILDWASRERRIVLTHDFATMPSYAYARVAAGKSMPGVIAVRLTASPGQIAGEIAFLLELLDESGFRDVVHYLPM
jgi:predicted nuclease of predicted toxin-antitoxin system